MAAATAKNTFLQRLIGAAALDAAIYEDVEADTGATAQAFIVVLLVERRRRPWRSRLERRSGQRGVLQHGRAARVGGVGARHVHGRRIPSAGAADARGRGGTAPHDRIRIDARSFAYPRDDAAACNPVFVATSAWMVLAMVVAVRQALDYTSTRALLQSASSAGCCQWSSRSCSGCSSVRRSPERRGAGNE